MDGMKECRWNANRSIRRKEDRKLGQDAKEGKMEKTCDCATYNAETCNKEIDDLVEMGFTCNKTFSLFTSSEKS